MITQYQSHFFIYNVKLNEFKHVNCLLVPVPVSKPRLWPLSSLVDRPTCWGQQVTVHCSCAKGSGIHYTWYRHTPRHKDFLLHNMADLCLHCGTVEEDSEY